MKIQTTGGFLQGKGFNKCTVQKTNKQTCVSYFSSDSGINGLYNEYLVSFKRKGKTEKAKLKTLCNGLLKNGCGRKEVDILLSNEKTYKKFLELSEKNNESSFSRRLTDKEILLSVTAGFDDDKIKRYINLSGDGNKFSRPLKPKEVMTFVKNGISNEQIPRYIELKDTDENGKTHLSRAMTSSEALCAVKNEFSDEQAEVYIMLADENMYAPAEFLADKNKCMRFLNFTSKDEKTDNDISSSAGVREIFGMLARNFDDERISRYIEIKTELEKASPVKVTKQSDNIFYKEIIRLVENEFDNDKIKRYFKIKNMIEETSNDDFLLSCCSRCAFDTIKNGFDDDEARLYFRLFGSLDETEAFSYVKDEFIKSRLEKLFGLKKTENPEFPVFSPREGIDVIKNNFDDTQALIYKEIISQKIIRYFGRNKAVEEVKNGDTVNFVKNLTEHAENYNLSRNMSIREAVFAYIENIKDESVLQETINLFDKNIELEKIRELIKFVEYKDIKNINELSLSEKRKFLKLLVSETSNLLNSELPLELYPIVPKTSEDYANLLTNLAGSVGINSYPLSGNASENCLKALNSLSEDIKNIDLSEVEIIPRYGRESFVSDVKNVLENFDTEEQKEITEFFGFDISSGKLIGYPCPQFEIFIKTPDDDVYSKINRFIKKYTVDNPVSIEKYKKAEKDINEILKYLPEMRTIIGKKQHEDQSYTLDIHSLKVLQNIVLNPEFDKLSEKDKNIMILCSLFHDMSKPEGEKDADHPSNSAFEAFYTVKKLGLSEDEQIKLYELIKTHDWLQRINTDDDADKLCKDYAFMFRHTNVFNLAKMLCEADIKAIKKDESLYELYSPAFFKYGDKIQQYIHTLQNSQIILPQTKIPKASEIENAETYSKDGITNVVLNMNKLQEDLSLYGFENGTKKSEWKTLVHGLDNDIQLRIFSTFESIDSEALLSTSYITPDDFRAFRKHGVILDVNFNDIHAGYYCDFSSGFKKSIDDIKKHYLFDEDDKQNKNLLLQSQRNYLFARTYISDLIKNTLSLTDEEYIDYAKKLEGCKSFEDIRKIDKKFADELVSVLNLFEGGKRTFGRKYNEVLVSRPQITAVYSYDEKYEAIPDFLRRYARDNDIPIIMFGKS